MSAAAPPETRTAVVTGASSGIGAAVARAFGALGWSVAVGARREDKLAEVARDVDEAGGKGFAHALDVTDSASLARFLRESEDALGPFDVVVSNAGLGVPGTLEENSEEDLRRELETNLLAPMLLARHVLPGMRTRARGDLVFVSSLNAVLPRPLQAGYTAAKAGVEALARVLQMELEGSGVRATIVRPGPTLTEMGWTWDAGLVKRMMRSWKTWGVLRHHHYLGPEAVAAAVVSAVTAPPGAHFDLVQVNPLAPPNA